MTQVLSLSFSLLHIHPLSPHQQMGSAEHRGRKGDWPVVLHHVGVEELVVGGPAADGLLVVLSQRNISVNHILIMAYY